MYVSHCGVFYIIILFNVDNQQAEIVISIKDELYSILFYSILFYSILFYN